MPARTTWSPDRRLLTTGIVGLITAVAFEGMAVPTVLPATVDDLGGLSLYGWAFAAFWLTNIVGITVAGADADRHGPRRALGAGLVLFCVGLLCSGTAVGMPMVIVGRAIQGFGSGAIGSVVYVAIARSYDPRAMPRMLALNSSAWVVPGLVGPALAAWVVSAMSWRWVFVGLVPAAVLAGAAVFVPVSRLGPSPERGQHPGGQALHALRLALGSALVLGSLTIGIPLAALPLLAVGLWLTVPALHRLLPAGSLALRPGSPAVIGTIGLVAFGFFGTEAFVPLAVTGVRHGSLELGGLTLSAAAVTWTTGSWIQARLAPRGWRRGLVRVGVLLIGAGIGLAVVALLPQAPLATAALAWAVAGLGMGLAYSTLTLLVLETAAPGREGAASAGLQLAFTLGTAFGSGVGGSLVALADGGILSLAAAIGVSDGLMLLVTLGAVAVTARVPAGDPRAELPPPVIEPLLTSPAGQLGGPLGEEAPDPPM